MRRPPSRLALWALATLACTAIACDRPQAEVAEQPTTAEEAAPAPAPAADAASDEADPRIGQLIDLSQSEDKAAVAKIIDLAMKDPVLPAVEMEALSSLEDMKSVDADAAAAGIGKIFATAPTTDVKLRAVEALDYLSSPGAKVVLLKHLDDPLHDVRVAVADALEMLVGADDWDRVHAVFEKEEDGSVRVELMELLENIDIERKRQGLPAEKLPEV